MRHIKLFEEFSSSLNEGAINVYPPGNPYKAEGSIQWTGVVKHTDKWKQEGQAFTLILDLDYDMYTANPEFRSKALGTWKDKSLPLFTDKFPRYNQVEFDLLGVEENPEKPNEPWLRVVDKKGVEFLVPPFKILDIQKGDSVKDGIHSGSKYLIDKMRAKIVNYKNGKVEVKLQDGTTKEYTLDQWKAGSFMEIEESKKHTDTEE
jgi:hypothetical protein